MAWWKFGRTKFPTFSVIEVSAPRKLGPLTRELRETLLTLNSHPGFSYLLERLKAQKAAFEAVLRTQKHEELKDVHFVQAAVYWAGWLQRQISELTGQIVTPLPASHAEQEEFENALRAISVVEGEQISE